MLPVKTLLPAYLLLTVTTAIAGDLALDTVPPCQGDANITPICNVNAPEDFELLPDGKHLLVSQIPKPDADRSGGGLAVMDMATDTLSPLPIANDYQAGWGDADCTEALPKLAPHGISLARRADGLWEILAVNHVGRESIERLELVEENGTYSAIWRGCVKSTDTGMFNDVDGAGDGSFVASIMIDKALRTAPGGMDKMLSGDNTGWLVEWTPKSGLVKLPNSESPFNNGIQLGPDQESIFFNAWTGKEVRLYDRNTQTITDSIALDFYPDNITQREDGKFVIAGIDELVSWKACVEAKAAFCMTAFSVIAVDPVTLTIEPLFHAEAGLLSGASAAIEVDGTLYIGTYAGDRLIKVKLEDSPDAP